MRFIPRLENLEDRSLPSFLAGSVSGSLIGATSYFGGTNAKTDFLQSSTGSGRLTEPTRPGDHWSGVETLTVGGHVYVVLLQGVHTQSQLGVGADGHTVLDTQFTITVLQAGIWQPHVGTATLSSSAGSFTLTVSVP